MDSFDDTSKIRRALKKEHTCGFGRSRYAEYFRKKREQPAGIIRETPRTLAPMALRPCLSTSLPKKCPILLKIDILVLPTTFYHTPPPAVNRFSRFFFIFYVVFFTKTSENVYLLVLFGSITFFCKVRKKVAGELEGKLPQSKPNGFASSLWEGASGETENFVF